MHYTLIKSAYEFDKNSNQLLDFTAITSAMFAETDVVNMYSFNSIVIIVTLLFTKK